jgi:hypothetical protein
VTVYVTAAIALALLAAYYVFLSVKGLSEVVHSLTVWLTFSVMLALAPLLFNLVWMFVAGGVPSLAALLGRGELLLVSVAVGADATGKLIDSDSRRQPRAVVPASVCILIVILASLLFSAIATKSVGATVDPRGVADVSGVMFFLITVAGARCASLAAE